MKLSIRSKLLIGFTILLILSSLIEALIFTITREDVYSLISNEQLLQAQKGADEIQNFFIDLNAINYGLASAYRENAATPSAGIKNESVTKSDIDSIVRYALKNNDHIKKI